MNVVEALDELQKKACHDAELRKRFMEDKKIPVSGGQILILVLV